MVFAYAEAEALARLGVEFQVVNVDSSIAGLLATAVAFLRKQSAFRPDLVHAEFGTATATLAAVFSRCPLVITFRGSDLNPSPTDGLIRDRLQKLLSQVAALRARSIVCVSAELRRRLWWRRSIAQVIPSAVDLARFANLTRDHARQALGWKHDEPVVLFNAGRDPRQKGEALAMAALHRAKAERRLQLCRLDGTAPYESMPLYLTACDCLLVTSLFEGSPNIVKEALAAGLPIVSVDVGDVAERTKGVHPTRIVGRSPQALARAIIEVVDSGVRSNGCVAVKRDLLPEKIYGQLLGVYRSALLAQTPVIKRRALQCDSGRRGPLH